MLGLHVLLAVALAAFADALSPLGVTGAFVLVFLVMCAGARLLGVQSYVRRFRQGLSFVLWFVAEIFRASLDVARIVLASHVQTEPAVVAVRLSRREDGFATLVGVLLTLTPGTLALEYEPDEGLLYVHALDIRAAGEVERSVRELERRLIAWMEGVAPTKVNLEKLT